MTEKGITNRGPKKRDEACLQVLADIVIPAGTVLRQDAGRPGIFSAPVAHGAFSVSGDVIWQATDTFDTFKRVVA